MTRRDIIIAAVIVNLGLLAVLFLLAGQFDENEEIQKEEMNIAEVLPEKPARLIRQEHAPVFLAEENEADEVDAVLRDFAESIEVAKQEAVLFPEVKQEEYTSLPKKSFESFTEITVKRGDVLSKIAKANGTTVSAIKKLNQLSSDRLQIGQAIRIPKGEEASKVEKTMKPLDNNAYYVVQPGDNPWKIAKKFEVDVKSLLELNAMDEKKAKALMPGDRIRVE